MAKVYYERDASLDELEDLTVAVIGYGIQGSAQAKNMKDSGLNVIMGLREGGGSWKKAQEDGFDVYTVEEAARRGEVVHMLIPDENQPWVYSKYIHHNLEEGNVLAFSHGFNIRYSQIVPPGHVDVVMMAPKGPGSMVRQEYSKGTGVPALIAVEQDYSGRARDRALAMAHACGGTRVGVLETTFTEETETDLFGEQVDLCGGSSELVKNAFDTLVEAGYQPEVAYFECLHELKLIVDLYYKGGIEGMWSRVSNTAEYGGRTRGRCVIGPEVKENMKEVLSDIQSGNFAKEWVLENQANAPTLGSLRRKGKEQKIEKVGKRLREMMKL